MTPSARVVTSFSRNDAVVARHVSSGPVMVPSFDDVIANVVLLMQPECFEKVMGIFLFLGIELLHPLFSGGDDFRRVAFAEFNAGAVAYAIDWVLQIGQ